MTNLEFSSIPGADTIAPSVLTSSDAFRHMPSKQLRGTRTASAKSLTHTDKPDPVP